MQAKDLRIVFMGTPEFAVPSLKALKQGGYNIVAVVTVPDKPQGRGLKVQMSDVKIAAQELGIETILQPESLKDEEFAAQLEELRPDLGIVIAFKMLPQRIWAMPRLGTFNLHASLLPQYRGAAPINWAIINGDRRTGITTFLLNREIDKGAIIGQRETEILDEDNVGTLYDRLMEMGPELVIDTVEKLCSGEAKPVEQPQNDESLRPAPKIFKDTSVINWSATGVEIINFIRGLAPYPAAWSRIYRAGEEFSSMKVFAAHFERKERLKACGSAITDLRSKLGVQCADGIIWLDDVQMASKKRMKTRDLLLGLRDVDTYSFI